MGRKMEWAASSKHLCGFPRKLVFIAAGAFAKAITCLLNSTSVHNPETLIRLVRCRPPSTPLITVSNHMSTLDDPLMWGFRGFPSADARLARWVLAADDICFKNTVLSYFFRLGSQEQVDDWKSMLEMTKIKNQKMQKKFLKIAEEQMPMQSHPSRPS